MIHPKSDPDPAGDAGSIEALVGRVLSVNGLAFTVTSASSYGEVCVWDPRRSVLLRFDSRETFENWAYGTPVPSASSLPSSSSSPVTGRTGEESK
jgi:hypothetical protein